MIDHAFQLCRPANIPDIGGCPPDCGHTEEEHIAFDMGLHAGEHSTADLPPQELRHSRALVEAWITGQSVGQFNITQPGL